MLDPGFWISAAPPTSRRLQATGKCRIGGEDRNRTYLGPAGARPTTVLKTARATRHPSLSERMKTSNRPSPGYGAADVQHLTSKVQLKQKIRKRIDYLIFLIAVKMALKSCN